MHRITIDPSQPHEEAMTRAVQVVLRGGLVAFPTDTLYGLTCDPRRPEALLRLYRLKTRPPQRRLPFVASDRNQAAELVSLRGELARRLADRFWPGPLTLILPLERPERLALHDWGQSLALRVPACAAARDLARRCGTPLPATSANLTGTPPVTIPERLPPTICRGVDLLLHAGRLPGGVPSTILDLTGPIPRVVRAGAVPLTEVERVTGPLAAPSDDV